MTLPHERIMALARTRQFLARLLDPKASPRLPKALRQEAGGLLKHYPDEGELDYREELARFWAPDPQPGMDGSGRIVGREGYIRKPDHHSGHSEPQE